MDISELRTLVGAYYDAPALSNVMLGCDCGCGGDLWSVKEWTRVHNEADKAEEELKKLGITFE